ncbi:MAG: hypothetical protein V4543_14475 [Bacteroidota bacterium]
MQQYADLKITEEVKESYFEYPSPGLPALASDPDSSRSGDPDSSLSADSRRRIRRSNIFVRRDSTGHIIPYSPANLSFFGRRDPARIQPGKTNIRLVANLDARNSFILGSQAFMLGGKLGLEFNDRWRTGIGYYFLPKAYIYNYSPPSNEPQPLVVQQKMSFSYFSLYGEYVMYSNRKWEFSSPVSLGFGNIHMSDLDLNGRPIDKPRNRPVLLIEPYLSGHYRIFSWVGIGAGVGYRHVFDTRKKFKFDNDTRLSRGFDSPIWIVKVKLFPGDILRVFQGRQSVWK